MSGSVTTPTTGGTVFMPVRREGYISRKGAKTQRIHDTNPQSQRHGEEASDLAIWIWRKIALHYVTDGILQLSLQITTEFIVVYFYGKNSS
jgi:hypothetical protein